MGYSLGVAKVDGTLTIIPTRTPSRPSEPPLSKEGWDSARICYSTKGSASRAARNRIKRTATGRYAILMGSFASSIARGVSLLAVLWTGLKKLGVKNAMYCDMGTGWNYSWYRKDDGTVKELFNVPGRYTTNWVVFYE